MEREIWIQEELVYFVFEEDKPAEVGFPSALDHLIWRPRLGLDTFARLRRARLLLEMRFAARASAQKLSRTCHSASLASDSFRMEVPNWDENENKKTCVALTAAALYQLG